MSVSGMESEEDLLPISGLQHLLFCERRASLVYIDGIWADNAATAEGTRLHERVDSEHKTEARRTTRIARGVWLRSFTLGLSGRADVVEFVRNEETNGVVSQGIELGGVSGSWVPFPVEYKRGHCRHEEGYEIQLCAQAMCLEEMVHAAVPAGAIFYGLSRRRVDVTFDNDLRMRTRRASARLREVLRGGSEPRFEPGSKCRSCSLENECIPSILIHKSANKYLAGIIAAVEREARCDDS